MGRGVLDRERPLKTTWRTTTTTGDLAAVSVGAGSGEATGGRTAYGALSADDIEGSDGNRGVGGWA
ncbi:hypothetical protein TRAPUB_11172 [Trametes pubescens]|uniref:Uncharacterized protein n=1 Tax=Trametes pubescens TaxID=154538 RepID=A0A1M2VXI6_TRAPU|nr:hypothetical protein TRAPUB_11172 [Trametes pubescens]